MEYDLFEHRHRFSVWAAARAAQRKYTASIDNLRAALESTDLRKFISESADGTITDLVFQEHHQKWCSEIVGFLNKLEIPNTFFGRAAKLVAVYIKSMVVVGLHSTTELAAVAHPPIDRILLQSLCRDPRLPTKVRQTFRKTSWTTLEEQPYYDLIRLIKEHVSDCRPFWRLERHWTVTQDGDS